MQIHEKVKTMRPKLALARDEATSKVKEWSFGLLHDALLFTGEEAVQEMTPQTLAGFVELWALAQIREEPDPREIRLGLINLGFYVTPRVLN